MNTDSKSEESATTVSRSDKFETASCTIDEGGTCTYHTSRWLRAGIDRVTDAHGVRMSGQSPEREQEEDERGEAVVVSHIARWTRYVEMRRGKTRYCVKER